MANLKRESYVKLAPLVVDKPGATIRHRTFKDSRNLSPINFLISLRYSRVSYWLALILILTILLFPLTIDTVPPLLDYPIHLARSYITIQHQKDPILREMFEIDWRPIPNLASDIILLFLGQIFKIETAGRILLSICLFVTVISVIFLHRVNFGYWSWWPLLVVIPAYHGALTAGFINYSIGIALIPSFLALSKIFDSHRPGYKIIINSISAIILYFCHVISVGLFGIFLFGCTFWNIFSQKNRMNKKTKIEIFILFFPFIIPTFLYINQSLSKVLERESHFIIGIWDFDSKIRGLIMPFMSGNYLVDFISIFVVISLFIYILAIKKMTVDYGLMTGVVLGFGVFFLLPGQILDASFITDRLPIAIFLVAIASTAPQNIKCRHAALFAALILASAVGRTASMTASWTESSQYYLRLKNIAGMVDRGSTVMILSPMTELRDKGFSFWHDIRINSPNWHFALLNIPALHAFPVIPLTRRAVFSQLHFVWSDKQILSLAGAYSDLDFGDGGDSTWDPAIISEQNGLKPPKIRDSLKRFDYALVVYADRLGTKLRHEIENQSPLYIDEELILLQLTSAPEAEPGR